jgi:hypothetical protein
VLGKYTNRIRWLGSDKNSRRLAWHRSTPDLPYFPKGRSGSQVFATRSSGRNHKAATVGRAEDRNASPHRPASLNRWTSPKPVLDTGATNGRGFMD